MAQPWPPVWPHVLQQHWCVLVHQWGSSCKCFFVLQQIWSGRCHMAPAPTSEATGACVLAPSFGWWVLKSGPASRDDLQHSFCHGQETVPAALRHRLETGNTYREALGACTANISLHAASTDRTVPPDAAPPSNDGKRPHQHSPLSHLPPPSPPSPCCCCCFGATSPEPRATGSADSVVGTHAAALRPSGLPEPCPAPGSMPRGKGRARRSRARLPQR